MASAVSEDFDRSYQSHLKRLKLKGLQPKTIDAYTRGIRRMGKYFNFFYVTHVLRKPWRSTDRSPRTVPLLRQGKRKTALVTQ